MSFKDDAPKGRVDIFKLGDHNAAPTPQYADIARAPAASEWKPGQKIWLSRFPPVPMSAELARVLELPRRDALDLQSPRAFAMADMMTERWSRGDRAGTCPECKGTGRDILDRECEKCVGGGGCACAAIDGRIRAGRRKCLKHLKPVQAWALYEMGIVGGLLGSIPVGAGKTAIGLLAPLALEPLGVRASLLLCPPNLLEQLHNDYRLLREHFRVPSLKIHGLEKDEAAEGPRLHVLPYSRLSLPTASSWIRNLQPDAIIADECDRLRDPNGAGSSRVLRYFMERGDTKFCGWTGSLTEASISDYSHLAALALRMQSPCPLDKAVVAEWARALDESDNAAPPGELGRLCGEDLDPEDTDQVREGWRRHLSGTLGVVVSTEASVDVDLVIEERESPEIPAIIHEALHKVRVCWVRPDTLVGDDYDEELVDAMQVAKCARELASGIFYRWRFDPIHGVPQKREDIKEWKEARKQWNSELRRQLFDRQEWLDSPLLCEHAAQRFHGDRPRREDRPEWESNNWPRWRDIKNKVKPTVEACRVSDYLAVDAARWALEHRGIVWYGMVEFGQWVSELSGLPMHGGGPDAGVRLTGGKKNGKIYKGEDGSRSIIASIKSHGRGRDGLQSLYFEQLIAQLPSSATMWEQLLGRLHRQGQDAPEVRAWYYAHTEEIKDALDTALSRAGYVRSTLGSAQKLLIGKR